MNDDNRPDDGDRCPACEASETQCGVCWLYLCDEHFDEHECPPDEEPRCPVCGDWERFHAEGCPRHPQYCRYATARVADVDAEALPW